MTWSKEWNAGLPGMWPEPKEGESVVVGVDLASGPDICIVQFETDEGKFSGQLVGDLIVYSDWGWKVAHYPTGTKFDRAVPPRFKCVNGHDRCFSNPDPNCQYCEKVQHTKAALLRWCDQVQTKHGSLWAILRELTPDNYDDKSARVMQAKDKIREHCLNTEVE